MLSEKRWSLEGVLRLFLALFGFLCVGLLFLQLWFRGEGEAWSERKFWFFTVNTLLFHGGALGLIHFFLRDEKLSWNQAFGLGNPGLGRALGLALLMLLVVLPGAWALGEGSARLMRLIAIEPEAQQTVQTLQQTQTLLERWMFGLIAILMAPAVEELLFRGILYPTVKEAGYPRLALWGTSIFFAVTHANVMTLASLTFLALALTWLYERTNNIAAPVVAHSAFNAINFAWLIRQI